VYFFIVKQNKAGRHTYNVTLTHVRLTLILLTWRIWWAANNASKWQVGLNSAFKGLTIVVMENKYYILWVCVCSLRYPACNAHSPFCYLLPVRLCNFFHIIS